MTALAAATALTLTACGTTEEASTGAGSTPGAASITLTDGTGAEVTLDGPATKVVGTEWNVVENLVSLGVDPVGVADVEGYGAWSSAVPLVNEPADIGTRGEPSVETIASLAPDLIVATTDLPADAVEQLKAIAPVLQVKSADGTKQIQQSEDNLETHREGDRHRGQGDRGHRRLRPGRLRRQGRARRGGPRGLEVPVRGRVRGRRAGHRPPVREGLARRGRDRRDSASRTPGPARSTPPTASDPPTSRASRPSATCGSSTTRTPPRATTRSRPRSRATPSGSRSRS
ncbi:ABC transporter substrate-binding protein [Clavibacter tessellarius]|uniref:ABC transporter substrate-binding protein n=1 Tax=Clavibacter tessellarius TaxID=31965 RepID=UPI00325328FC